MAEPSFWLPAGVLAVAAAVIVPLWPGMDPDRTRPVTGDAIVNPAPDIEPARSEARPAAALGAESHQAEGWGTFRGKVTLKGSPPPAREFVEKGKAAKDPEVCAADAPILSESLVFDEATRGVKNVLVYIPRPTAVNEQARSSVQSAQVVFDQEKCVFKPHLLAIMTGVDVHLKNSDPILHNINSRLRNNPFNKLLSRFTDMPLPVNEMERTPGELICDIHPWMKAFWIVLDNPYFAVTDDQGNFEIKNVPAGTQKVVVWHEAVSPKFLTAPSGDPIDIRAGDVTTRDFTIDAAKIRPE
jgi:hypothetical protein